MAGHVGRVAPSRGFFGTGAVRLSRAADKGAESAGGFQRLELPGPWFPQDRWCGARPGVALRARWRAASPSRLPSPLRRRGRWRCRVQRMVSRRFGAWRRPRRRPRLEGRTAPRGSGPGRTASTATGASQGRRSGGGRRTRRKEARPRPGRPKCGKNRTESPVSTINGTRRGAMFGSHRGREKRWTPGRTNVPGGPGGVHMRARPGAGHGAERQRGVGRKRERRCARGAPTACCGARAPPGSAADLDGVGTMDGPLCGLGLLEVHREGLRDGV